jgi:2-amino-4-hydroxy-6-hydroxymethyldihydropteridine diphosphokinase
VTESRQIVLALGSNLGDRRANLQAGVYSLAAGPGLDIAAVSGVYETKPIGGPPQPDYFNAVLLASSGLPALQILRLCQAAEQSVGRDRSPLAGRWGPRTLDVDVIACGAETSDTPDLTLPHPRAHLRAFVLAPWHDVDPTATLPGHGSVASLLEQVGLDGVTPVPQLALRTGS